jgi:hypothetical protein
MSESSELYAAGREFTARATGETVYTVHQIIYLFDEMTPDRRDLISFKEDRCGDPYLIAWTRSACNDSFMPVPPPRWVDKRKYQYTSDGRSKVSPVVVTAVDSDGYAIVLCTDNGAKLLRAPYMRADYTEIPD